MIQYQQEYYKSKDNCRKMGMKWAQKVYLSVWKMTSEIWKGRNEQLHNTHGIQELQGLPIVKQAFEQNFN